MADVAPTPSVIPPRPAEKRTHAAAHTTDDGHAKAVAVLQRLLPILRPSRTDSLDAATRLELLLQEWTTSAYRHDKKGERLIVVPAKRISWNQKSRFKKEVGEAWNLVTDAPAAEKDELIALVRDLATDEGRARLVAMYEAKLDGTKDDAIFENVEQTDSSEPTDTNDPSEAKLPQSRTARRCGSSTCQCHVWTGTVDRACESGGKCHDVDSGKNRRI